MKFVGTALAIPAGVAPGDAVRKQYVDAINTALGGRVTTLEGAPAGSGLAVVSKTAAYTALAGQFVLADASTAAFTVTLPAAPAVNTLVAVKKVDVSAHAVTVAGSGATTVDGAATLVLGTAQAAAEFVFDGTNWQIASGVAAAVTNLVTSVATRVGDVVLTKSDVGLGNLDNTADVDKPVSTAQAAADAAASTADRARANHTGTQLAATISDFTTAADARITVQKGAASGLVPLDSGSKIASNYLPAIAITSTFSVASQAAQLALVVQEGDVAIRTDISQTYIQNGGSAGTMADWSLLATPTDAVTSVAGRTGVVTLSATDVGLAAVNNTSDAAKPVSTAAQSALNLKADLAGPTFTGVPAAPTATAGTSTTQIATTAFVAAAAASAGGLVTVAKTGAYTAVVGNLVLCDATPAAFTITLPAAPVTNAVIAVKKTDTSANIITIVSASGALIDTDANCSLVAQGSAVDLQYDGAVWRIVSTALLNTALQTITYRGAYAGGTAYAVNDVVTYSGSSYVAVTVTTGNLPTNTTYWAVFAAAGVAADPTPITMFLMGAY